MDLKKNLTNEKVRAKFVSQFDLVNYAIRLAANMIHTGRDARVKVDSQNRAMQVLGEIIEGKDQFDDIVTTQEVEMPAAPLSHAHINHEERDLEMPKATEKKKSRKL
jgi:DNA-directed RNA polymerase subunit omega